MKTQAIETILDRYDHLRLGIVGDVCLDRYFEIDPSRGEISIETGLEVYNIDRVRCQPGAAGTILNNLVALGIPTIHLIGFCGEDAEGWQLRRALQTLAGVHIDHFITTPHRHTFTYTKPLVRHSDRPPEELHRLDQKNWTSTPREVSLQIMEAIHKVAPQVDALMVMDQVDHKNTGVMTDEVLKTLAELQQKNPSLLIMADSRRSLKDYPPMTFKMNAAELGAWVEAPSSISAQNVERQACDLARSTGHEVYVSMAEHGICMAQADGQTYRAAALPVQGPIDVVGAGDAVTANLVAAKAAGAQPDEVLTLAMKAASCVIHQLGTTGVATRADLMNEPRSTG